MNQQKLNKQVAEIRNEVKRPIDWDDDTACLIEYPDYINDEKLNRGLELELLRAGWTPVSVYENDWYRWISLEDKSVSDPHFGTATVLAFIEHMGGEG